MAEPTTVDDRVHRSFLQATSQGWLKIDGYRPATEIGRFDAVYRPADNRLTVTSRLNFQFLTQKEYEQSKNAAKPANDQNDDWRNLPDGPVWTAGERQAYKDRFKQVIEATWSNQYKFVSREKNWKKDYSATVTVVVEPNTPKQIAHYGVRVIKDENLRAMVAHDPLWDGIFGHRDVQTEDSVRRDTALGIFTMQWIDKLIETTGCDYLPFEGGSSTLTRDASQRLADFGFKARRYLTEDAVNAGLHIWVYAQTGPDDARTMVTAGKRKKAIVSRLKEVLRPYSDVVQTVSKFSAQPWIRTPLRANLDRRAANLTAQQKDGRKFSAGMLMVKSPGNPDLGADAFISIPRNYVVVAHEFGHMLGLPDEYLGVQCNSMRNAIAKRTDLTGPVAVMAAPDARRAAQQEGFAALIEKVKVPAPILKEGAGTVTDSIMYAGSRVLPAHYVNFYGALVSCTYPYFQPEDWELRADRPTNANLLFAGS